jgi:hypothetical protein
MLLLKNVKVKTRYVFFCPVRFQAYPDPYVPLSPSISSGNDSHTIVDLHRHNIFSEVETSGAALEPSR